jgi:hypothetical protein
MSYTTVEQSVPSKLLPVHYHCNVSYVITRCQQSIKHNSESETCTNGNYFFLLCAAALNLKEIPYDIKPVSLIKAGGEQHCNEYREINPMEQVPALHIDGHTLVESVSTVKFSLFMP